MTSSLYIHIPFCQKKCDYCNFYSVPISESKQSIEDFLQQLYADIKYQFDYFDITEVPTVYIGGGSPSVLGHKALKDLLLFVNSVLPNIPSEWTIELNPQTTNEKILQVCKRNNVNRVSIGIQSFNTESLNAVGRFCSTKEIKQSLILVKTFFGTNFSADLISGLPAQNLQDDIKKLLEYNPSHISLYDLSIEDGTPLQRKIKSGHLLMRTSEDTDSSWLKGRNLLLENGYDQYEVSAFSKPGKRSIHNVRYWQLLNWIGCGPGASGTIIDGFDQKIRLTASCNLSEYKYEKEILDKQTLIKESILMGFRYIDGPDTELFYKRFNCRIEDVIPKTLKKYKDRSMVMLFLNKFLIDCLIEVDEYFGI
ncbi:MAG: radical SAM family heme chaperone HemW [Termitinemataceae bacterium]|nr:MAG: radical SAM family heme chaperone HemW [Termitinemataceae bacterium]